MQPIEKRIHTSFDPVLREVCEEHGIYSKVCKNRADNVYLFADLVGAMEHTQYMGNLDGVEFEKPAIILADLHGRDVQPDIENLRYAKGKTVKEVIEDAEFAENVPVTVKGNIDPENIVCVCILSESFFDTLVTEVDIEDFTDNPSKYGFVFNPEDYDLSDEDIEEQNDAYWEAYTQAEDDFLQNFEANPHFSKYVKHVHHLIEDSARRQSYGMRERDDPVLRAYNFSDELIDMNNWECNCKK